MEFLLAWILDCLLIFGAAIIFFAGVLIIYIMKTARKFSDDVDELSEEDNRDDE